MEFLGLLIVLISVILIYKKPEKENLAFGLFVFAWVMAAFMYYAHVSALLPNISL